MTKKSFSETFTVTKEDCISALDKSLPSLLGTYVLVKWMEIVSAKNINRQLGSQYISVGQMVSIEHTEMVKLGEKVEIVALIQKEEKRNVTFSIEAFLNGKLVANALHERVIIPTKVIKRLFK